MCLIITNDLPKFTYKPAESHIILHAYHLWLQANQPLSDGVEFYYMAEKECNYEILYKLVWFHNGHWNSPCMDYEWELGWNQSTYDNIGIQKLGQNIREGFHFFIKYDDAEFAAKQLGCEVVTAHCYKEDFVAMGKCSSKVWVRPGSSVSPRWQQPTPTMQLMASIKSPNACYKLAEVAITPNPNPPPSAVFSKCYIPKLPKIYVPAWDSRKRQNL